MSNGKGTITEHFEEVFPLAVILVISDEIELLCGEPPAENTTPIPRRSRMMLEKSIKDK